MRKYLAVTLMAVVATVGCSSNWTTQALAIAKVVLPAAINVLQLVAVFQGAQMNQSAALTITNDFALVTKSLQDYQSASASAAPGILGQLNAALTVTQNDIDSLISVANIHDAKKVAEVKALTSFVIGELAAIQSLIPQNGATTHSKVIPLSPSQFRHAYNGVMKDADPSLELK